MLEAGGAGVLLGPVPGVELSQGGCGDTLQHLLGEDTQQLPADVKGLEESALHVRTLGRTQC